ncbi:MAG: nuclear transport factor 2 family protein [Burkholderiaceae bacterium]|jgi:hypothetical protein|nr:nuclear transport factor 2 family protein [Burkholderiaceae bacterium]
MHSSILFGRRSIVGLTFAAAVALTGTAQAQQVTAAAATPGPTPAQIQELWDKQAITELINTYPRGLDRLDRDLLLSIGHPDAKMTFGKTEFPSWAAYVDWLMKAHEEMTGNNHRMTNILIRVNGDHAVSETTGTATLLVPKAGDPDVYEERWMHSRYLDTWSRRNGKWGLDGRKTVSDYRRISYVSAAEVKKNYQVAPRTGKNDPSYKLFGAQ